MTRRLALLVAITMGVDQWDETAETAYRRIETTSPPQVERRGDGVVYAMGGRLDFVEQEVVPCVRYLRRFPKIIRYALFSERKLLEEVARLDILPFFDEVMAYEDVAKESAALLDVRVRVKILKAHAMLYAPFERFVWLDFDSRPCRGDFATLLLQELETKNVDALLHNQWPSHQDKIPVTEDAHYKIEHNSAIAVFDARRPATVAALSLFVDAFRPVPKSRSNFETTSFFIF